MTTFRRWLAGGRKLTVLRYVAVPAVLGASAVWIHSLRDVRAWAAVAIAVVAFAVEIYLLWPFVRKPKFLPRAAVVVAVCVCGLGVYLLWGVWDGKPVAAAFTRVGGPTRVETALEASRFWLTSPSCVVVTQSTSQSTMFSAAWYAVQHNAPLLFTSGNYEENQLVNARIAAWGGAKVHVITFPLPLESVNCQADPANINSVTTLSVPNQPSQLPWYIKPQGTLASVVVFAAAINPGNPSDVAVGLALAAHMASPREPVSLVEIPHYLESDPDLETALQDQHELVTGGVVLGDTPTVPEDTRALLRQLLTSTDRLGVAAQIQANLGSVGSLIAALLAVGGLVVAVRIGGPIVIEELERAERDRPIRQREKQKWKEEKVAARKLKKDNRKKSKTDGGRSLSDLINRIRIGHMSKESDWLAALGSNREVIIWLRSGRQVTGTIKGQFPEGQRDATVLRIEKAPSASLGPASSPDAATSRPDGAYVLVSVNDIELIHFNDPKSETGNSSGQVTISSGQAAGQGTI